MTLSFKSDNPAMAIHMQELLLLTRPRENYGSSGFPSFRNTATRGGSSITKPRKLAKQLNTSRVHDKSSSQSKHSLVLGTEGSKDTEQDLSSPAPSLPGSAEGMIGDAVLNLDRVAAQPSNAGWLEPSVAESTALIVETKEKPDEDVLEAVVVGAGDVALRPLMWELPITAWTSGVSSTVPSAAAWRRLPSRPG